MAKNDFKPFAIGAGANVMSQADWEALPALLTGFQSGKASSAQMNKIFRQAGFIAAALAQYTVNKSGLDVLDDGDLNGFIDKMTTAFGKDFQALDATLTALAGLATGANKLPYFTGTDTAAQTDLTQIGRDVIGQTTVANLLTYLGLGTAATKNVGNGTGQIPTMANFTSGPGWVKFPDGTIIQTGVSISGPVGFPTTITFPIPFTVSCRIATSFDTASNAATECPSFATSPAGTGLFAFYLMSSRTGGTGAGANWIAIGK
ncbi:gp53-like domain-containing protein [Enterobacter asburiae]|uniref:gp53-like domain-containing protein n=1 Tax=Enterobacter asburiae TaxID=61645 RepID=UPI002003A9A7|nr:phage tail protein [Enterobacter asburiae]MCK6992895.1 phage tail protein [Enterobacter asburiae]